MVTAAFKNNSLKSSTMNRLIPIVRVQDGKGVFL